MLAEPVIATIRSPRFCVEELLANPEEYSGLFRIMAQRAKQDGGTIKAIRFVETPCAPDGLIGQLELTLNHYP